MAKDSTDREFAERRSRRSLSEPFDPTTSSQPLDTNIRAQSLRSTSNIGSLGEEIHYIEFDNADSQLLARYIRQKATDYLDSNDVSEEL
jgi:hypothetical protein